DEICRSLRLSLYVLGRDTVVFSTFLLMLTVLLPRAVATYKPQAMIPTGSVHPVDRRVLSLLVAADPTPPELLAQPLPRSLTNKGEDDLSFERHWVAEAVVRDWLVGLRLFPSSGTEGSTPCSDPLEGLLRSMVHTVDLALAVREESMKKVVDHAGAGSVDMAQLRRDAFAKYPPRLYRGVPVHLLSGIYQTILWTLNCTDTA
ncbi:hypothetical protein KIPB_003479, partial [Kipferlia bialata]